MTDILYMQKAIELARQAALEDEVPVGAVVVHRNAVIGTGYNRREQRQDPIAHAEVLAIAEAARTLGSWRLEDCTLYVTLEPCPMCLGAAINARVSKIVYGAADPKAGACGSVLDFAEHPGLNHRIDAVSGLMAHECGEILREFFRRKRTSK